MLHDLRLTGERAFIVIPENSKVKGNRLWLWLPTVVDDHRVCVRVYIYILLYIIAQKFTSQAQKIF